MDRHEQFGVLRTWNVYASNVQKEGEQRTNLSTTLYGADAS